MRLLYDAEVASFIFTYHYEAAMLADEPDRPGSHFVSSGGGDCGRLLAPPAGLLSPC
jgi:hypothetical protein